MNYLDLVSRKYKFRDQDQLYFVSFATVYWIDLFVRPDYFEILIASLRYCQTEKGLELHAWCIMPSHVHLIIGSNLKPLQDILRDFKSYTSRKLREAIQEHPGESRKEWILEIMGKAGNQNANNHGWQLWQQHNHPIELATNQMMNQCLHYLHMNPVVAGFVTEPEHWNYSSAIDYSGGSGLLDIYFIE